MLLSTARENVCFYSDPEHFIHRKLAL